MLESTLTNGGFMKRMVLGSLTALGLAILALAITPAPAKADTISVTVSPGTASLTAGSYSYATVGGDLVITGLVANIEFDDTTEGTVTYTSDSLNITTGDYVGTLGNVVAFGPNTTPGSITISGGSFPATLLTGYLNEDTDVANGDGTSASTNFTVVTIAQQVLNNVGDTTDGTSFTGSITADLSAEINAAIASSGTVSGATGNLDPAPSVPESGSLSMLSVGLLGIGLLGLRRRNALVAA
jgi:hypothetical protein